MKLFIVKTSAATTVAALALCLTPALRARSSSSDSKLPRHGVKAARNDINNSARAIVGQDVRSKNGEDLGEVKNLVVDTNSGQVLFALITQGGVLGIGESIHAVPYSLLTVPQQGHGTITVNTDKATLDSSPTVREDAPAALADRGSEIYSHYNKDWKALTSSAKSNMSGMSHLMTVDQISGKDVVNNGRKVGAIEDVIISSHKNQSAALLDPDDDYTGTDQKFLISFNQLKRGPQDNFSTTLEKSKFANATPGDQNDWWADDNGYPYAWQAGYAGVGYSMNHPATVSVAARSSISDIRQELRRDPEIKQAVDHISFDQQNDTLVLHGAVASTELRQKIDKKLNLVATGWNIDNQLTVRNATE